MLDAISDDMITLVGPPAGDQTQLGRTERHTQGNMVPETGTSWSSQCPPDNRFDCGLSRTGWFPAQSRARSRGAPRWDAWRSVRSLRPPHSGVARCQDQHLAAGQPRHEAWLRLNLGRLVPWVLPTGPEPFGLLHHHRCQPPRTRAVEVVLAYSTRNGTPSAVVPEIASSTLRTKPIPNGGAW